MGYYQTFLEKQNRIEEELKKEKNRNLYDKYKESRREYSIKNKERINQKAKEYYWKNREQILEKNKMKKLYTNEYYKEWYQKNKIQVNKNRGRFNTKSEYIKPSANLPIPKKEITPETFILCFS